MFQNKVWQQNHLFEMVLILDLWNKEKFIIELVFVVEKYHLPLTPIWLSESRSTTVSRPFFSSSDAFFCARMVSINCKPVFDGYSQRFKCDGRLWNAPFHEQPSKE